MELFHVDFYGIALLTQGETHKRLGESFDANVIF